MDEIYEFSTVQIKTGAVHGELIKNQIEINATYGMDLPVIL